MISCLQIRPNFLDVSKTIGILIVVYGHYAWYFNIPFENNAIWNVAHLVTLFHMPLFFFISGLLHKQISFKDDVNKVKQRLMVPYVCLNV